MLNFFLDLIERCFFRRPRREEAVAHLETGLRGEEAAEKFLREHGYTIFARRWSARRQRGDLDLIAWKSGTLVFVEVKARTAHDRAAAEINVDRKKRQTLRRVARVFLRSFNEAPRAVRFDLLSVYLLPGKPAEVEHIQSAFKWHEESRRN